MNTTELYGKYTCQQIGNELASLKSKNVDNEITKIVRNLNILSTRELIEVLIQLCLIEKIEAQSLIEAFSENEDKMKDAMRKVLFSYQNARFKNKY